MNRCFSLVIFSCFLYSCYAELSGGAISESEIDGSLSTYRNSIVQEIPVSNGITRIAGFEYFKGSTDPASIMSNRFNNNDSIIICNDDLKIVYINPLIDSSANFNKTKGSHTMDANAWSFNGDDAIYEIKASDFEKFGVPK